MGKGFEFRVYTSEDKEYQDRLRNPSKEPHRCDDRLEDLCRAVAQWGSLAQISQAWRIAWACLKSEEGEEPHDPYVMLTPEDPLYKEHKPKLKPWQQAKQQQAQEEQQQQQEQQQQRKTWRRLWL